MDNQTRHKTKYPGVFYRIRNRIGGSGFERVYYIVFRRDGKVVETVAGRQYKDDMTDAKAATKRGQMIEGNATTKADDRAKNQAKVWNLATLWAEYISQRPESKSRSIDDGRFQKYIKPVLGDKKPAELVQLDIARLKKAMKELSPQTIKHVCGIVKRVSRFGVNMNLCPGLTFDIKMPAVDNVVQHEYLDPPRLRALLEAIEADENKIVAAMMKLALYSGMRRGEMFRLKWEHLDFHGGSIHLVTPKGGKAQNIPLNNEARLLLKGLPRTSEYCFPGDGGGQRVSVQKASRRIRERAGLPKNFRPLHGLRHCYASMLARSGKVDMYVLQKLLTHKSPQMTQRYAHLGNEQLRDASAIAGGLINEAMMDQKKEVAK